MALPQGDCGSATVCGVLSSTGGGLILRGLACICTQKGLPGAGQPVAFCRRQEEPRSGFNRTG